MLQDEQLVPSGSGPTYNAVDDTSMAGSNGSPIVEHLEDRLGPSQDAPGRLFYVYPRRYIGILCRQLEKMSLQIG